MRALAGVLVLAACGRVGFDSDHDGARGDGGPSGSGDATTGAGGDGARGAVNRAFVSSTQASGSFGGVAGGDAICASAAAAAGLDGTFVAWLSTATVNAIDRLAGSRGWVRVDGAALLDQPADLVQGGLLSPLDVDEHGQPTVTDTWTGTLDDGTVNTGETCADWAGGGFATKGVTADGLPQFTLGNGADGCSELHALYCFELGHDTAVAPVAVSGRVVFVSAAMYGGGGLASLDTECATEAANARLPGTFLAGVATTTASPQSRFVAGSAPWVRVDGTVIATSAGLFTASHPSFVNQHADGSYVASPEVVTGVASGTGDITGTSSSTCANWTGVSAGDLATVGEVSDTALADFWDNSPSNCDTPLPYLCMQA
jgi:hypothetical protein